MLLKVLKWPPSGLRLTFSYKLVFHRLVDEQPKRSRDRADEEASPESDQISLHARSNHESIKAFNEPRNQKNHNNTEFSTRLIK